MKRTALTLTLMLALSVSIIAGVQTQVAEAFLPAPAIIIYSPAPIISTNTSIPLSVGVNILNNSPEIVRILYSLDGNHNVTSTNLTRTDNFWFDPNKVGSEFRVTSILENLTEGNHTLKVYSQDAEGNEMSSSIEFTVDTHYKYPEVVILSPQNTTYASSDVPLTFTVDRRNLSADYILEGEGGHISVSGNTTLTGLSNGTHTITVYIFAEGGQGFVEQGTSLTISFTVSPELQKQTEPFPTLLVIAVIIAVVAVVAVGLLACFKKHKR